MSPDSVAHFNQQKATNLLALHPATVVFDHVRTQPVSVAFGEVSGDAELHSSGQSSQFTRTGALYFPLFGPTVPDPVTTAAPVNPPDFPPRFGQAFTITVSRNQLLLGTRWQIDRYAASSAEGVIKFTCHQLQA